MEDTSSDVFSSIMQLPDDCLSNIFQWLHSSSDRDSFGLTCHRWLNIQNTSRRSLHFQCSLTFFNFSSSQASLDINPYHLHRLLTRFQHLQYLSLSGCTELPDLGLTPLQFYGSELHALHLDCCFGITDYGLSLIPKGCPSLMVVSLYRCNNITDVGLETLAKGCTALKHINLAYCPLVSDHGLEAISQTCYQLKAVKISFCRGISGIGFKGCSPTLVSVDAECCNLQREGIMGIVSGGGLEHLNIPGISWSGNGDWLAAIGAGFATRLKILNLRMCRTVGDGSIVAIAKGCPLLQEWNLALCHDVRISGWKSIAINCNNLEKLHVNRCRNLHDSGLQALREGCKKLLVLYISHCCRLSPTAIELFKLHRGDVEIKPDEVMCIGPDWTMS